MLQPPQRLVGGGRQRAQVHRALGSGEGLHRVYAQHAAAVGGHALHAHQLTEARVVQHTRVHAALQLLEAAGLAVQAPARAGGPAGLFSAIIGGWPGQRVREECQAVTHEIRTTANLASAGTAMLVGMASRREVELASVGRIEFGTKKWLC